MKILVTGATGFVGRHVVSRLLASGHSIVAVARDEAYARSLPWFDQVNFIKHDLKRGPWNWQRVGIPDVLIHLAWSGLPNYRSYFHVSENLPSDIRFLESAVRGGLPQLIVAGTCLEYGMQFGPLCEEGETRPVTSYGLAKDTLRKSLELLQHHQPFKFQWIRLFYVYGEGQNPNSLHSQLDRVIDDGLESFEMSLGDQLRDYLPIETVARCFDWAVSNPNIEGVINCCSGKPQSVLDVIRQHLIRRNKEINLERGHYPYPDYEPMAFWGLPEKLEKSGFFRS